MKVDTFVFFCRDIGIAAGEATYLLQYYYSLDSANAKKLAFESPAWGAKGAESLSVTNEAFNYFSAFGEKNKKSDDR